MVSFVSNSLKECILVSLHAERLHGAPGGSQ